MSRLHRQLGISQGVGLLATSLLGTGVFVIPAIAASISGRESLLAWLLLIVFVLPIAFTFAALGKHFPHAGGAAHFAGRAFGPMAERLTAFLFISVMPVGLPAALLMACGFWQSVLPISHTEALGVQFATLATILLLGLNGAKLSGNIQIVIAITITSLVALLWWKSGVGHADTVLPSQVDAPSLIPALTVMFWCFVGIEAFAHMGEEFRNPERDFPIAVLLGVLVAGVVYWATSVVVLKLHAFGDQQANTQSLPYLVAVLFGPKAKWIAALVGYMACFASINIYLQGFARLLWSMADEGMLPKPLAQLSARKVPANALYLVVGSCALCCLLFWWLELPLDDLLRYANGNFIGVYLLSMIAGVVLLKGVARILAVISSVLCLALLIALGLQASYMVGVSLAYIGLRWVVRRWRAHLITVAPSTPLQ
jgi:amino acid efflux transporter